MEFRRLTDNLLARHGQGALGQVDVTIMRQHLGRQPDRHGHREQERFPASRAYKIR